MDTFLEEFFLVYFAVFFPIHTGIVSFEEDGRDQLDRVVFLEQNLCEGSSKFGNFSIGRIQRKRFLFPLNCDKYDCVDIFLLIMNHAEFRLVHNQKENCQCDHTPLNLKGIRKTFI